MDKWGEKEVYCLVCLRSLPEDWEKDANDETICDSCRDNGGLSPDSPFTQRGKMLYAAKARAKKANVPFDITVEDIGPLPMYCPVLGIKMQTNLGSPKDNSPSLDRIKPALGYVKGNIAVMSWRANRLKSDSTADELERVAAWMRQSS